MSSQTLKHSVSSSTLADVLERILDKGIIIAGDIKIKLVDIELLTIQIRLMIASVDKAKELGIDWWTRDPNLSALGSNQQDRDEIGALKERIAQLEAGQRTQSPA